MTYQVKRLPAERVPRAQMVFWIIVRIAMTVCASYSFFVEHDVIMGLESVFCLIFTHLWDMFQIFGNGSFIEEVPPLNQTMLNFVIFVGIVLGSYLGLFDNTAWFDKYTHFQAGFICGVFGFDFACIIQRKKGECAVTLAAMFGLMFAVTVAAGWEFYEFFMDRIHDTNLQLAKPMEGVVYDPVLGSGDYGLIDTMQDMMMNTAGGVLGMIFIVVVRLRQRKVQKEQAQQLPPGE